MLLKRILILMMLFLGFWGCKESALDVTIKYDQLYGLEEGDRVVFEQNHIGEVTRTFYSKDGYYLVDVEIRKAFANSATEHSKFFITDDPRNNGKKAIEIIQTCKGGLPLEDGATVKGSSKTSAVLTPTDESLEKKFKDIRTEFERLLEELATLPESREFKKLQRELEGLAEEMKRSGESVREKVEQELLPRLRQEIEKLRKRLQKFGREEEAEELETQLERIRDI